LSVNKILISIQYRSHIHKKLPQPCIAKLRGCPREEKGRRKGIWEGKRREKRKGRKDGVRKKVRGNAGRKGTE